MDRELIEGLSNLSASLDRIYEALTRSGDPKSATAAALKMGNFETQIKEISASIIEIKEDTQKILNQQDTILKMLSEGEKKQVEPKINKITPEQTSPRIGRQVQEERQENFRDTSNLKESPISMMKKFFSELTTTKIAKERTEDVNTINKKIQVSDENLLTKLTTVLKLKESREEIQSKPVKSELTTMKMSKDIERDKKTDTKDTQVKKGEVSFWNRLFPNKSINEKIKILTDYFTKGLPQKDTKKIKSTGSELTTVKIQIEKQEGSKVIREEKRVKAFSEESTTVKVSKDKRSDVRESKDSKVSKISEESTTTKIARDKKEERKEERSRGGMFGSMDTKKIKDGVSAILLIAVGIVAIGLALKLVGRVDFVSVMAIALALPFIAIAFAKIASVFSGQEVTDERGRKYKSSAIDIKQLPAITLGLVGFSAAIAASSWILSKVKPIGLAQAVTAILIGGVFSALSFGLHKLVNAFGRMSLIGGLKAVLFMPLVLVAISTAIALSSYVLSAVKPIGVFQAISAIMIAGVFSVLAYGLGKLIRGFKGIDPITAYVAAKMMPIVLLAVTATIAAASYLLSAVKPIGFFQALTAILIAGVFTVLSFGIGKIISSFRRINPATALAATAMMPLVFIALSFSIMMSSYFLSNVKVIGLFQALTAIAISIVFVALSFGLAKILPAFRRLSPANVATAAVAMPIIFIALSLAIMVSSYFLSGVKPIGFAQFLTSLGVAILFVAFSFATNLMIKGLKGVTTANALNAMKILLMVATTVAIASFIVAITPEVPLKKTLSFGLLGLGLAATTVIMAFAIKTIKKIGLSFKDVITGGLMILAIATTIALSSLILSIGKYEKYPTLKWALGTGLSIVAFGLAALGLGTVITATAGLGALAIGAGLLAVLAIAATIVATDKIISTGSYTKYPGLGWSLGVGGSLIGFAAAVVTLGVINSVGGIASTLSFGIVKNPIEAGSEAVIKIARLIPLVDKIVSTGSYTKYPGLKWALGVGGTLTGFATAVVILGALSSGGALVQKLTLGLVKNPIEAGVDAVIKIAKLIPMVDKIISSGSYTKYPGLKWALGVGGTLTAFGTAVVILGALNSGGGLVQKLTLGLVKNPIDSGIDALKKLAKAIVDVDKILSGGNFTKGPSLKWSISTGFILTAFTGAISALGVLSSGMGILAKLTGAKDPIDAGISAVKKLSNAIVDVDRILSTGKYTGGPNSTWSRGISLALGAFSPIYSMLVKEKLMSIFGKGVSTKDFAEAIRTISQGIVDSANFFGRSKVAFQNGPPVAWADGISKSLGAFSPIYTLLLKDSGWFKSGVSPKLFAEAIKTISRGIVDSANFFGNAKVAFQNGPPVSWADGVSKSLSAFQPIYELLMKNSGWWKSGVDPKAFAAAIRTISQGIVDSAKFFGSASTSFKNGPPVQWAEGVGKALSAFQPIYELLLKNSGWWKSGVDPKAFAAAIRTISQGIVDSANILSKGKASFAVYPTAQWAMGVSLALSTFSPIYKLLEKDSGWWKSGISPEKFSSAIRTISKGIVDSALILSKGKSAFGVYPTTQWAMGVSLALSTFSPIYKLLEKDSGWLRSNISPEKYASAIRTISTGIRDSALILSKGAVAYKSFPTVPWANGVSRALSVFQPIYKILEKDSGWFRSNISPEKYASAIKTISKGIVDSALILAKGKSAFGVFPTTLWADGVSKALRLFQPIYKILEKDSGWFRSGVSVEKYASAIRTISKGIADSAMILSKVKAAYSFYPTTKWADGVSKALSTFSPIYSILSKNASWFKSGVSPSSYASAIKIISQGIADSATILSKVKSAYSVFPSTKWSEGVSSALSAFSPIYSYLEKNSGFFGTKIDKLSLSVIEMAQTIVKVSKIVSTGNFGLKITSEFSKSILTGFSSFFKILSMSKKEKLRDKDVENIFKVSNTLNKMSSILSTGKFSFTIDPKFITSIRDGFRLIYDLTLLVKRFDFKQLQKVWIVSDSILKLSNAFKTAKFDKFPSQKWSQGVNFTFDTIVKMINKVDKSISMATLGFGILKITKLVNTILNLDTRLSSGKFNKFPNFNWTSGVSKTITEFGNLLKNIDKSLSIVGMLTGVKKINTLVNLILDIDKKFTLGKYRVFPSEKWKLGTTKSLFDFSNLISTIDKKYSIIGLATGMAKTSSVVKLILDIDKKLSLGKYSKFPLDRWRQGTVKSINDFSNLLSSVDKKYSILGLMTGIGKTMSVVKLILDIDKKLSSGRYTRFPVDKWRQGSIKSINEFSSLVTSIDKKYSILGLMTGVGKTMTIVKSILDIDKKLSLGKYTKFPVDVWRMSTIKAVNEFGNLFLQANKIYSILSLKSGIFKIDTIIKSVLKIEKDISKGKYNVFPNKKWIDETKSVIFTYGKLAIDSNKFFGIVPLLSGVKKVKMITELVLWIDKTLAKGKYSILPNKKWIGETKNVILTYGKLAIDSNKLFGIVPLLAGIKKIKMITESILWVDKTLSKGSYVKTPNQNWLSRSKSSVIQYGNLAIDVNKKYGMIPLMLGLKKVRNIADTIRNVSVLISRGNYTKFPSLEWSKSVPAALSGFMNLPFKGIFGKIFDTIFGDSEDSKKSQLGKIVDLMLYVDKRFQSGNWKKFPTVEWVKGTILALQKFKDIVSLLSFSSLNSKIMTAFGGKNPLVSAVSNIEKLAQSFDKLGNSMKNFSQSIKTLDTEKLAAIKSLSSNVIMMSLMNPEQFDAMIAKLEERSGVFADLMKNLQDKKGGSEKMTSVPGTGQKVAGGGSMTDFKMPTSSSGAKLGGKSDEMKMLDKLDAMTSLLADISSVVGSKGALKTYLSGLKEDVEIGDGGFSLFGRSDKRSKNILKKIGVSPSGINIYLFSYKFDPTVVYQGVIAQELLGTNFEKSVVVDKSGYYAVDYSKLDVVFKRTN